MLQTSITWLDFSEQDRQTMTEVLSLFRVRDTRDELGLGSVRDALANLFFPGTSTLQTRARYFLFVPWIYLDLEQKRVPSRKIERRLKRDEIRLMEAIEEGGEERFIGETAGASLQRFPSSIYWNGLATWGLRRYPGSQAQYHRWLDRFYERQQGRLWAEDGESMVTSYHTNWDPHVLDRPAGLLKRVDFDLTLEESEYLRERLLLSCRDSLLATLVDQCRPTGDIPFVWQHPELAIFPQKQQGWMNHARNFSEVMYGAVLLYNLMLAELRDDDDLQAAHRARLSSWWAGLQPRAGNLAEWDRGEFWKLVQGENKIPPRTQQFAEQWLDLVLSKGTLAELTESREARSLVREREVWLKRGRSRFESRRHLEMWSGGSGLGPLDYRWPVAQRIADDILQGLGRS